MNRNVLFEVSPEKMAQLPQNADAVIARMKQSPHSSVDGSGGSPDDRDEGRQFKVPHPPLSPENRASSTQVGEISLSNDVIERGYDGNAAFFRWCS